MLGSSLPNNSSPINASTKIEVPLRLLRMANWVMGVNIESGIAGDMSRLPHWVKRPCGSMQRIVTALFLFLSSGRSGLFFRRRSGGGGFILAFLDALFKFADA